MFDRASFLLFDLGVRKTFTETVSVQQTYSQQWSGYNAVQLNEKIGFFAFLSDLSKVIEEAPQTMVRPRYCA